MDASRWWFLCPGNEDVFKLVVQHFFGRTRGVTGINGAASRISLSSYGVECALLALVRLLCLGIKQRILLRRREHPSGSSLQTLGLPAC